VVEAVVAEIARGAPDADSAARRCERILAARSGLGPLSPEELQLVTITCRRAPYLATLLARDPLRLRRVATDPLLHHEKPRSVLEAQLAGHLAQGPTLAAALRRCRGDELVRLGARELGQRRDEEVGHELARLAEVCFDAAITAHRAELVDRWGDVVYLDDDDNERPLELAVIGMGKLGGEELNFSSDVDVIYIYSSDRSDRADRSLHQIASQWCRQVTATIGEITDDDCVFRVDLRLRPEGSRGPIANSLHSAERYYEAWGRPWERQAWLKARACAGSVSLGRAMIRALEPFVYPRQTSPAVVDQVIELNRRIKAQQTTTEIDTGFDVKNGAGGIREIEFFAQALQLVHAGQRPALRTRSTRGTLDQLLFAGLITAAEHRTLADAYRFLRRLEHVLQLDSGRQTQRLPADRAALAVVARRAGFPDVATFRDELTHHTGAVARLFATLGGDDAPPPTQIATLLAPDTEPAQRRAALAALGFRDPDQAARNLDYARRKPASALGPTATGAAERTAPALLAGIAASPDPDQALGLLVDLVARRGTWSGLWRLFDDNPTLLQLVASLMGTSAYLSRQFVNHPELIDVLVQLGQSRARRTLTQLSVEARARLGDIDDDDDESFWSALSLFKLEHVLRIGLGDIAGELDPEEVCTQLSNLAEVCLAHAYDRVRATLRAIHGEPSAQLAVLGLGKLGSRELGYASDLDIVFVYSHDGTTDGGRPMDNVSYLTRLAQRLVNALHTMTPNGRLYETDTRLRPEGSKGLLVSSLAGWRRYHETTARLWERQALIKLRPVAGDASFGDEVATIAETFVYRPAHAPPALLVSELRAMRDRIERERGARGVDIKTGRGGLIDVEFAAQFLQLVHGHAHEEIRVRGSVAALRAAARLGLADRDSCLVLADGYRYLRRLEHRLRIVHDRSEHRLPDDGDELDKLAHRLRVSDGRALVADYRARARAIRAAYDAIVR